MATTTVRLDSDEERILDALAPILRGRSNAIRAGAGPGIRCWPRYDVTATAYAECHTLFRLAVIGEMIPGVGLNSGPTRTHAKEKSMTSTQSKGRSPPNCDKQLPPHQGGVSFGRFLRRWSCPSRFGSAEPEKKVSSSASGSLQFHSLGNIDLDR